MMEIGNRLVLALEDIIHHVANVFGSWGTMSSEKSKNSHEQNIRAKCLDAKVLFNDFQGEVRNLEIYNVNKNDEIFKFMEDYSIDELITDFMVGNDINRLIDNAHDICYKLRKLLLYLEKQQN